MWSRWRAGPGWRVAAAGCAASWWMRTSEGLAYRLSLISIIVNNENRYGKRASLTGGVTRKTGLRSAACHCVDGGSGSSRRQGVQGGCGRGVEVHPRDGHVLLEVGDAGRAGDEQDVRIVAQQPGQADLGGCAHQG